MSLDLVTKEQQAFIFLIIRDGQEIVREIAPYPGQETLQDVRNDILLTILVGYTLGRQQRRKSTTAQ
ncbi:MAG: hypothetical protein NVSMB44_32890 [Ktedonobacteraceae bacterium]